MLAALACVDWVVVFAEDTPEAALARLQPDVHCKGADYAPPNGKPIPESQVVQAYGGRVEFLPLLPARSTTDIVQRILESRSRRSRRCASHFLTPGKSRGGLDLCRRASYSRSSRRLPANGCSSSAT